MPAGAGSGGGPLHQRVGVSFIFVFGGTGYTSATIRSNGRLQFGNTLCGSGTASSGNPQTYPYGFPNASGNGVMKSSADQSCQASHPATVGAGRSWLRGLNGSCAATADRDPAARASLGIFSPESRRTVHLREIF